MSKKKKFRPTTDIPLQENKVEVLKKKPFIEILLNNTTLQYVFIFVISFVLYGNTLILEYALDDRLMITENNFTKNGFGGIKDILTNDSFVGFFGEKKNLLTGGRYRPLSQIMFAIEYEVFGLKPFYGHLLNLLFYAMLCCILLNILKRLFHSYKGLLSYLPYLVILFFMAHPLHTEIVANIKGRDDIMSLLFSLLILLFVIKYIENRNPLNLAFASLFLFLGLMSKENAITFLGVIPLCLYFFYKLKIRDYIVILLPLVTSAALFIYIRFAVLGFELNIGVEKELLNNPFVNSGSSEKFATIFYTMGLYLKLLILPHPLTHDYYPFHIEIVNWQSVQALLPLIIYISLGVYAVWGVYKKQLIAFGVTFYLITFSIASNIVFNIGTFMNERFMFVPLLGFCIILAYCIVIASKKYGKEAQSKSIVFTIALVIMVLYSLRTISRNPVWKNDFTLFTSDVKVSVNSAKCNVSAGGVLIEYSQKEADPVKKETYLNQAVKYLGHGLEIHPRYVAGWVLYGNAFLYLDKFNEALSCYENALNIAPTNNDALNNMAHLAQLLNSRKYYDFSISTFHKLATYAPLSHDNSYMLARSYEDKNRADSAMVILFEILREDSLYQPAHAKLGELYGKLYNNLDKSLEHLHIAYKLKPDDGSNLENLGIAYGMKRDFVKSLYYFEESMKLNPEKPELYLNISQTYAMMGNNAKAEEYKIKAQGVKKEQ